MENTLVLEALNVCKSFGTNCVLKDMGFQLRKNEVHALLGINGAGKSTLIKIISGAYTQDSGKIYIDGKDVGIMSPTKAMNNGVATIYQETSLYPQLSVTENLFVGRRVKKGMFLDWKSMEEAAGKVFERMGVSIDLYEKVANIGKANAQLVEIARSLLVDAKVLIMDEPTSSLSRKETDRLFEIIRRLKAQGTSIIYISHRMEEIFEIADRLTVLRDGRAVGTKDTKDAEVAWITGAMLGKETEHTQALGGHATDEVLLKVQGLNSSNVLHDIDITVHRGEIVALMGLVGAGRTETIKAIVGIDDYDSGDVEFKGVKLKKRSFNSAIKQGIGLVPEDRGRQGLILDMKADANFVISALPEMCNGLGVRDFAREKTVVKDLATSLMLSPNNPEAEASSFSGGNQQKIAIGRWIATEPELLVLDEPTCGVDISAKFEIYKLIDKLAGEGKGILVISSDLTDIEILADKIYVMRSGRIVKQLPKGAGKDKMLAYAIGGEMDE